MPKTYLTFSERERAAALRERDKQLRQISLELLSTKYCNGGFGEIKNKTGLSMPTIKKVATTPLKSTLEQVFEIAIAAGKRVTIQIE